MKTISLISVILLCLVAACQSQTPPPTVSPAEAPIWIAGYKAGVASTQAVKPTTAPVVVVPVITVTVKPAVTIEVKPVTPTPATAPSTQPVGIARVGGFRFTHVGTMAPAVIHVDCVDTTGQPLADKSINYHWDFGDAAGDYNHLPGWNAAHLYDVPGTYDIVLTISDASGSKSFIDHVTIAADTRRQVHVSDAPSLATAIASDTHIFLKPGAQFKWNAVGQSLAFSNLVIEGDGGMAKLDMAQSGGAFHMDSVKSKNVMLRGIEFDGSGTGTVNSGRRSATAWMGWTTGENIAIVSCQFDCVMDGIQTDFGTNGLLLQHNWQHDPYCISAHFIWLEGTDLAVIDNIGLGSLYENVFRIAERYQADLGAVRALIYSNTMSRPLQAAPFQAKASWTLRSGRDLYIANNKTIGTGGYTSWMGFEPRSNQRFITNCLVCGNTFQNSLLSIRPNAQDIEVCNNTIINLTGGAAGVKYSADAGLVKGIYLHHNTATLVKVRPFTDFYGSQPGNVDETVYREDHNVVVAAATQPTTQPSK